MQSSTCLPYEPNYKNHHNQNPKAKFTTRETTHMIHDDMSNFLTYMMTFHDLVTILTTLDDYIWWPSWPLMKKCWWHWQVSWWTLLWLVTTYLVTTINGDTENLGDDINNLWWHLVKVGIQHVDNKDDQVTMRMTNDPEWQCGNCCMRTKVTILDDTLMTHGMGWPKYDPGDPTSDDYMWPEPKIGIGWTTTKSTIGPLKVKSGQADFEILDV